MTDKITAFEIFQNKVNFVVKLEGNVDGEQFTVEGSGYGHASSGIIEGKFVCTSGELPVAWQSIISACAYGMIVFARYPNTIKDFFKSAILDGYLQDRTMVFENDGTYETKAKVTYKDDTVYNHITLEGKGFSKDGHVRGKRIHFIPPSLAYVNPYGDGIRMVFKNALPTKDGGYQVIDLDQVNEPMKKSEDIAIPSYHFIRTKYELSKDPNEKRDHIVIWETVAAFTPDF